MKKTWKHASLEKVEHTDMQVTTRDGHPIPLRLYRPKNIENKKLPVLIFYHGGGFVIGSVKGYHNLLSALCDMNQCMVASMDYRLAPKHPYPVPMQDTLDVTEWLLKNADHILAENKFVFAGDSAGGNLAAVNAHAFSRQYKDRIKGQLLICPTTDRNEPPKPSYIENAKVLPLTAGMMDWFGDNYTKNAVDINDPGLY
ncbi:MAG: alpha/beta hydrolase, partial [Bacteroidia bacterium]|nr:alpha/beta hydrolase [Bacteroidia bacterium]